MGFIADMFGADEAKKAARARERGFDQAEETYRTAERTAREGFEPYQRTSQEANRLIQAAIGGDFSGFEASPGYNFRKEEGEKAIERGAAARGMSLSGAQMKDLGRFNQGLASTEYGNWFNRMSGLRGEGIGMENTLANIGMNTASGVAGAQTGRAGARASGYMAKANIKSALSNRLLDAGIQAATMGMGGMPGMGGGGQSMASHNALNAASGYANFGDPFA